MKINSVACRCSPAKIYYSDYPKFYQQVKFGLFFSIKYRYSIFLQGLLWNVATVCFATIKLVSYCVCMVSVTSTSRYQSPLKVEPL